MTKRRTEITVETERLLLAHVQRTTRVWCVRCGLEVSAAADAEEKSDDGTARSPRPHEQAGADAARGDRGRAEK